MVYYGVKLFPRESLIIFDEVQLFPTARQMIKNLVKDKRYDYIETGSLLSLNQNTEKILLPSEEESINMYPMDFEEFCLATNNEILYEYNAFIWLNEAMLTNLCFNSTDPNIGLKMNVDRLRLKAYFLDTGLLINHCFDEHTIKKENYIKLFILVSLN